MPATPSRCRRPFRSTAEQGTKRKRGGQSEDDDDESGAHGEAGNDATPLCW